MGSPREHAACVHHRQFEPPGAGMHLGSPSRWVHSGTALEISNILTLVKDALKPRTFDELTEYPRLRRLFSYPHGGTGVKTLQMTLEPQLLRSVDRARQARTSRAGFIRSALGEALARIEEKELERRHREGYTRQPVHAGEFDA